jgi:hypothetical protein
MRQESSLDIKAIKLKAIKLTKINILSSKFESNISILVDQIVSYIYDQR